MHRLKNAVANLGALLTLLGLIAVIALVPAWIEIGHWSEVLSWFTFADAVTLFEIGDRP